MGEELKLVSKILTLPVITTLDIQAERVLDAAKENNLQTAIVIGYDADGEFYFCSTAADGGDVLWLLETAKKRLFEV